MEFNDLIKLSEVRSVKLRRPFQPTKECALEITGHHLFLTNTPKELEVLKILHRCVDAIERKCGGGSNGVAAGSGGGAGGGGGTLVIKCKDLQVVQVDFLSTEEMHLVADSLEKLCAIDDVSHSYAFSYKPEFRALEDGWGAFAPEVEFSKLIHSSDSDWRISYVNKDFKVCRTYPRAVIVPACITDDQLKASANFRHGGRFPVLSYRHTTTQVVVRCSQPLSGPNHRRCREDERLLEAILSRTTSSRGGIPTSPKGFIIDTRTQVAAQSERAKGGGYENEHFYPRWRRINKAIDRYHFLLDSYSKLMEACSDVNSSCDKWLSRFTISSWLTHVKEILNCGCLIAQVLDKEHASVVVHGSEGVDITLCVTALAQIILNPDCRTIRGFEALVEREWIQAGHPFWSRTAKGPFSDSVASKSKSHAPTFTIFLDCVFQIYNQFPCSFEFTELFLVFLSDHAYASEFGTFLCDCESERAMLQVDKRITSLWAYVNRPQVLERFMNCLYEPNKDIIWPSVAPISLSLWSSMYLRWIVDQRPHARARDRARQIVIENREARAKVSKLRKEVSLLLKEAERLGILTNGEEEDEDKSNCFLSSQEELSI